MAIPASSVWVQLYYEDQEQPDGLAIEITPLPRNVFALADAVNAKLKLDSPLNKMYVYSPGTKPPFAKENCIRPGMNLQDLIAEYKSKQTPYTSDEFRLIVVAPPPESRKDLVDTETLKGLAKEVLQLTNNAVPVPSDDSCWEEIVNTEDFHKLRVVGNNKVATGWRRERQETKFSNLFLRKELTDAKQKVDDFLSENQRGCERLFVNGAPGCGKTSFFLWYACQSRKNKYP